MDDLPATGIKARPMQEGLHGFLEQALNELVSGVVNDRDVRRHCTHLKGSPFLRQPLERIESIESAFRVKAMLEPPLEGISFAHPKLEIINRLLVQSEPVYHMLMEQLTLRIVPEWSIEVVEDVVLVLVCNPL